MNGDDMPMVYAVRRMDEHRWELIAPDAWPYRPRYQTAVMRAHTRDPRLTNTKHAALLHPHAQRPAKRPA